MMIILLLFSFISGCVRSGIASTIILSAGSNTTLPCHAGTNELMLFTDQQVYWQWPGVKSDDTTVTKPEGSMQISNLMANSSGTYTCHNAADDSIIVAYTLLVPGPPSAPANLSASEADSVLVLRWRNTYSQEYLAAAPDTFLRLRYRPVTRLAPVSLYHAGPQADWDSPVAKWHQLPHELHPGKTWAAIQHLEESASYQFELWAENSYGRSAAASVSTTTPPHSPFALTRTDAWQRSRAWLISVVVVLAATNLVAGAAWLYYCNRSTNRSRRRHRAVANHSGLSGECEQLELVCHAHEPPLDASLTLPHHAALV